MMSGQLEPIAANEDERSVLAKVEKLFNLLNSAFEPQMPSLIGSAGEEIQLQQPVFRLLHQLVHQLAQGKGVMITTFHQPLTIEEAAALLNVQRQHKRAAARKWGNSLHWSGFRAPNSV